MSDTFVLDRKTIVENMGGDEELFIEMARMYVDESDNYCQSLLDALTDGNTANLAQEAHTMKSLLATFSDEEGRKMAIFVEQKAKQGEIDPSGTEMLIGRIRMLAGVLREASGS